LIGFNVDYVNLSDFGASYNTSIKNLPYGSDAARSYLPGVASGWKPVEIEVYQVTKV
jgi:hypothetical protein